MDKLPVYEMVINENPENEIEVSAVAFVDKPAIEKNFLAFKDQSIRFAINEERHIVSGPAMLSDTLIYRKDENGEYNVFFSKDTIEKIVMKFFEKGYQKNINLFHDPLLKTDQVTIFESIISDASRGIQPMKGFEDAPDGSWFISAKVDNPDIWNKIKDGTLKGFSVEGIFSYVKKPKNELYEKISELLNATDEEKAHIYQESSFMSKLKDALTAAKKAIFGEVPPVAAPNPAAPPAAVFMDYTTKDGKVLKCDKLEVGGVAMMGEAPAPAGDYELADGTKMSVGDGGAITAVTPAQQMSEPLTRDMVKQMITEALNSPVLQMAEHKKKVEAAEATITDLTNKLKKQEKINQEFFSLIEKLADLPTGEPVEHSLGGFNSAKVKDKEARIREISDILTKRQKAQ